MRRVVRLSVLWALLSLTAVLGVVVALGSGASPGGPASAESTGTGASPAPAPPEVPYPYATSTRVGPWGFATRHSTDYVAWRFFQRDVPFSSTMSGPNGKIGHFGDPGGWPATAVAIGFRVDAAPKVGAVAQWRAGEQGAGRAGHVAYVERVNADGSVVVSEFDWTVEHGYSQRGQDGTPPVHAPRYIHIQDR
jgi:surface antigen